MSTHSTKLFDMILETQDKYDKPDPADRCDRCDQYAVAKLFFEPKPESSLPTLMLCSADLMKNREALEAQPITGGYLDTEKIWWLESRQTAGV